MKAVDLFAGAGGASRGIHDAGYDVLGFEYWQPAVDTHLANGLPVLLHDLSDPSGDALIPECDLMWASPPCQPFSAAGDGEGEFDERDGFPWTLRIVARLLPDVVIIENVKGLTFDKHADYFGGILQQLTRLGYEWDWKVLNSADYGVPQTRERCFIVCRRDGGPIVWPTVTHTPGDGLFTQPWVSVVDALPHLPSDLVARHERGAGMVERHGDRPDRELTMPAMTIRQGGGGDPGGWILTRPATTINCDPRVSAPGRHDPEVSGSQQAGAIRLTIAELAALQGFPADWIWTGTKTAQARQVGNAVPPIMAQLLTEANRPLRRQAAA